MAILEGRSPREKLEKSYFAGLKANWVLWPAVQAINFSIVPLQYRVLVVNIVSLGTSPSRKRRLCARQLTRASQDGTAS
jgi:Mpv17 / PMP22 family